MAGALDKAKGYGEAGLSIGSALLGSVPAGLGGLYELIKTRDPKKAAEAVESMQESMTYIPRTEQGVKSLQGAAGALETLGAPAAYVGEKTLGATGSPLAATAAEVVLDPLNLLGSAVVAKGTKGAVKGAKAAGRALAPKAAEMTESYMRGVGMMPSITEGVSYGTKQEGPFYRVAPADPELARLAHRGVREAPGQGAEAAPGGAGGELSQPVSDEAVKQTLADPNNFVKRVADRYAQELTGRPYELPKIPESSLVKQSPIGRVFQLGATDDPAYKAAVFDRYGQQFPELLEQTGAQNYDQLLEAAYRQLAKETKQQFESLPVNMSFHRAGEGNYLSSNEMLKDVYGNRHLYVFQGGDPHQFLNDVDPKTGLNSNEMFRAVHDFYGHAIHGNQFGPKGEEIAYAAHSQMFSPLARLAMASETRGQNSVVNYTPLNAALKAKIAKLDEIEYEAKRRKDMATVRDVQAAKKDAWGAFQFAPQKGLLLPPEFVDVQFAGGMPDYIQPLIRPQAGTTTSSELVHFSKAPGLTQTDPRRYGQGIKGEEAERLSYVPGAVKERTYFYAGEPEAVTPEPGLGPYKYRAQSGQLYDVGADPLELRTLATESSRTPFTAKYNPGMQSPEQAITDVERMIKEYGYEGMVNPKLTKPTAIMYGPTAVQPFAEGGAVESADISKPAFKYPSSGKRPERLNQSRDVNVPLQLARGWAAGTLGLPGDIEGLVRLLPGLDETPVLPTSDFYREWLPGYDPKPAAQAVSGLGALSGGVGATKVAREGMGAVKRATDVGAIKNYIRSAQQASGLPGSQVIKPKGGNWMAGSVEEGTRPLRSQAASGRPEEALAQMREMYTPETASPETLRMVEGPFRHLEQESSLNKWIDTKLNKYIKNEMGTPEDPVRALAERGILHAEPRVGRETATQAQFLRGQQNQPKLGKSDLAKDWENLTDTLIEPYRAGTHQEFGFEQVMKANPWLSKVSPDTQVYELGQSVDRLGFDHLIDELRNAVNPESGLPAHLRWSPKDLEKVTVPQAVERVAKINEWRAAQKAEADAAKARNPATFVVKEYPEQKMQWVELKMPPRPEDVKITNDGINYVVTRGDEVVGRYASERTANQVADKVGQSSLEDALKYEGEVMGHCVGGYCPDVEAGKSRIYSLRDKKGEPHVTIEVQPGDISPFDMPPEILAEYRRHASIGVPAHGGRPGAKEWLEHFYPEVAKTIRPPDEIIQIKGKGNRAPKEEYLPMVQDFVRGGTWGNVGDLKNAGLYRKGDFIDEFSPDQLDAAGKGEYLTMDEIKKLREGKAWKPIDTDANWGDVQVDLPPPNYAEGGPVSLASITDKIADQLMLTGMDRDQAILQASRMADAKMQDQKMAAGGAVKRAVQAAVKAAEKAAEKAEEAKPLEEAIRRINEKLAKEAADNKTKPIAPPPVVANTTNKMADQIAKKNPKLSEVDVAKKAERSALAKLKWEREEKPALESRYGLLARSTFDDPLAQRLRNVPEVVEQRIKKAEEFLAQPTESWKPPRGALQAFDRSLIKDALEGFPGIEQTRFPRYEPARADTGYIDEIYGDPRNRALIEKQIKRGLPLGGETFYASLYPVKVAAMERGMSPEKFEQFVYQTAPASARNSIMNEMAVGQFLRDMNARGLPLDDKTVTEEMAKFKQQYGTGLPLMPVHREGVRQVIEGGQNMRDMLKADIPTNYKIPTYGTQKAGDFGKSMVLDVHESAGQTQGSRYHPYFTEQGGFGPTEYGLAESKMLDIANEMGIPGGMAQAGRWFGGGELTGLKSPRGDALDLLERQVAYTMQGQGIKPTPKRARHYVLDMIESGRGVLMPYFKSEGMPDYRVEKKKGGAVKKPKAGALAQATR